MSTKIYKAWRVEGISTLAKALKWGELLRPKAEKIMHEKLIGLVEGACAGLPPGEYYREHYWGAEHPANRELLSPRLDLIFIPSRGGCLLLAYHSRLYGYETSIETVGARFWGYWNNVDPDENCTPEEWDQRRRDWERALRGSGVPAEIGMQVTILGDYLPLPGTLWPPREACRG